jgi:hypothetical protein
MKKQRTWYGCDANKAVSLFEQGLLVRYVSKKKGWQCLYLTDVCPKEFSIGWTSERVLEDVLSNGWAEKHLHRFLSCCGYTRAEWNGLDMASRISDFIGYFGELELFGENYWGGYTTKEVCKRLQIKYKDDYEIF